MRRFNGGHKVVPGMYWNAWDLRVVGVNNEAILPGDRNLVYYRIPFVLVLPLGAILGGVYVFFLPVVSIATAISVLEAKNVRTRPVPREEERLLRLEAHRGVSGRKERAREGGRTVRVGEESGRRREQIPGK